MLDGTWREQHPCYWHVVWPARRLNELLVIMNTATLANPHPALHDCSLCWKMNRRAPPLNTDHSFHCSHARHGQHCWYSLVEPTFLGILCQFNLLHSLELNQYKLWNKIIKQYITQGYIEYHDLVSHSLLITLSCYNIIALHKTTYKDDVGMFGLVGTHEGQDWSIKFWLTNHRSKYIYKNVFTINWQLSNHFN